MRPLRSRHASPLGDLVLTEAQGRIIALDWAEEGAGEGGGEGGGASPLLDTARRQLDEYFAGRRRRFTLPLAPVSTPFQHGFFEALMAIPFGETRTYGELARVLEVPAQAVGQACGANPIPILIPCHRVLGASGPGGYSGRGGVETKLALLRLEGAVLI